MDIKLENNKLIFEYDITKDHLFPILTDIDDKHINVLEKLYNRNPNLIMGNSEVLNKLAQYTSDTKIINRLLQYVKKQKSYSVEDLVCCLLLNLHIEDPVKIKLSDDRWNIIVSQLSTILYSTGLSTGFIHYLFNKCVSINHTYMITKIVKSHYCELLTDDMLKYCLNNNIAVSHILCQISDQQIVSKHLTSRYKDVKLAVIQNPILTPTQLEFLFKRNKDPYVRKLIIEHPNCPDSLKLKINVV